MQYSEELIFVVTDPTGRAAGAAFRCKGGGRPGACTRLTPLTSCSLLISLKTTPIDKDVTHQRHHEQVQRSDQSRQQLAMNPRLDRIRRTLCCGCPSALEKSLIPDPPGEVDVYSNFP